MKIGELKPLEKNPFKSKGDKQIELIAKSISSFQKMMEIRKIVIDENNEILGGNKRYFALKMLNYTEIPDNWIDKRTDLTEEEKKEFIVKDNAHWGSEWDFDLLKEWSVDLQDWGIEMNFEDIKIEDVEEVEPDNPEEIKTEIKEGDIFQIGKHRLMCGDCTIKENVDKLMNGEKADMIFTDPPYSVNYEKKTQEIFKDNSYNKIMNDEMSVKEISEQIWGPCFANMYDNSKDDCSFYMTMPQGGDQMMMMMMMMGEKWRVKHELIWVKPSPVFSMGRLDYDYKHEPIMYGWKNKHNFYGKGKFTKSVWEFGRDTDKLHPTMKPVDLIINALLNSSVKENIVIDYFGGSGSTMAACEQLNRICYMMELDPVYCQVIINRMKKLNPNIEIKCLNRDFNPINLNS